jgi:hypothetical protein
LSILLYGERLASLATHRKSVRSKHVLPILTRIVGH